MESGLFAGLALGMCVVLGACAAPSSPEEVGSSTESLDVCAASETLQGIDVSHHNADVDWRKVKASGRTFAFARTSDGLTTPDTQFAQNWPAMKAAGIVRGAYQFYRPKRDPLALADLMLKTIADNGGLEVGDLPPVLDLEVTDGVAASIINSGVQIWLDRVESKTGVKPIVYTGNQMTATIGTRFSAYPLWVAHYGVSCPRMPGGWTEWSIWQNGEAGSVPGVTTGGTDTDFFNGKASDLAELRLAHAPHIASDTLRVDASVAPDGSDGDAVMGSASH